jgi:hypothetical protein
MIRHQQEQIKIPSRLLVINARCASQHGSRIIMAKLIHSTSLTANGDEIDCAKAPGEMRRVIESFPHDRRHFKTYRWSRCLVGAVHRNALAIEVNGRYLAQCLAQRRSARSRELFLHAQFFSRTEPDLGRAPDVRGKTWRARRCEFAAVGYQTRRSVEQEMLGWACL